MSNPQKRKGDKFELAVQDHHQAHGFPDCEKTRAGYERDHGDLHPCGDRRVVAQCKNFTRLRFPEWLDQLEQQIANAGAEHGYVVVKRTGVADPGKSYVLTTLEQHQALLLRAGYGTDAPRGAATPQQHAQAG